MSQQTESRARPESSNGAQHYPKQLPDASRKVLVYMADLLRRGFTGRFELECHQGGVRTLKKIESLDAKSLPEPTTPGPLS